MNIKSVFKRDSYLNTALYIAALITILSIKVFYDNASSNQLLFVLWPIKQIVSLFHNGVFIYSETLGYVSNKLGIIIGTSCAGIDFMLILFAMLCFTYIHYIKSSKNKIIYFIALFPITYFTGMLINSFRIITSITIQQVTFLTQITSPEVIHNVLGMLIFICFLLIINYIFSKIIRKDRYLDEEDT